VKDLLENKERRNRKGVEGDVETLIHERKEVLL
jgi:hypothetical protein